MLKFVHSILFLFFGFLQAKAIVWGHVHEDEAFRAFKDLKLDPHMEKSGKFPIPSFITPAISVIGCVIYVYLIS